MQQYPYPQQPPPQRSGANVGVVIAIVAVVFVVGIFGVLFLFGFLGYMSASRSMSRAAAMATSTSATTTTATTTALTESYASPNGLVTAHYPSDWAAKSVDTGTLTISRNLSDGTDELVYVAGVDNPISNDVNEFSRILINSQTKTIEADGSKWTETVRRREPCFKGFPGLRVDGTFTVKTIKENVRMCFFIRGNRGYAMKTMVPAIHETEDLPLVQSMIDGTDIK